MQISLGTVQFGIDYGITKNKEKIQKNVVRDILNIAWQENIKHLDTAPTYGNSQRIIASSKPKSADFEITTKTISFQKDTIESVDLEKLAATFLQSLVELNKPSLERILIHRSEDLFKPGGRLIYEALQKLKQEGLVRKIGISAYDKTEILSFLEKYSVDCIQLPLSLLDQRLTRGGFLPWLKSKNIEIEARSVFLQGALLMPTNQLPLHLADAKNMIEKIKSDQSKREVSVLDACVDFVKSQGCVDRMVVGVQTVHQLRQILEANNKSLPLFDYSIYAIDNEKIVNPTNWPRE